MPDSNSHGFAQMVECEPLGYPKGNFRQALLFLGGRREANDWQQRHVMIRFFFQRRRQLKLGEKRCGGAAYF